MLISSAALVSLLPRASTSTCTSTARRLFTSSNGVAAKASLLRNNNNNMGNVPIFMAASVALGWAASKYSTAYQTSKNEALPTTTNILFVWDFDWTIINCNSDEYIPAQFLSSQELQQGFRQLYKTTNGDWHACVSAMIQRTKATPHQILEAAKQMPYLTSVRQTIEQISKSPNTSQMILSDGNTLFIGAFLEAQQLLSQFDQGIVTNIGSWTPQGQLKVIHQSAQYGGHNCPTCSANLCKTQALTKTMQQNSLRPIRIVYIGDGGNDACPALRVLQSDDILLARVGNRRACANQRTGPETDEQAMDHTTNQKEGPAFGILPALQKAKQQNPPLEPKCQVWEWTTGEDLRILVERILNEQREE